MPTFASREPDRRQASAVAHRGLILLGLVGSTVHGLAVDALDDRDELGVCVEPPAYLLGTRRFEHLVWRTQSEGIPSGAGDVDLTVYGLHRYCMLARKGSITVLLPLFVEGEGLVVCTRLGQELRDIAPWFATRRVGESVLGYLLGQRSRVRDPAVIRPRERVGDGYDGKYAMHALRLAIQGTELMRTGRITLPMPEPDRSLVLAVRRGEVDGDTAVAEIDRAAARLQAAMDASTCRDSVDDDRLDRWLTARYLDHWDEFGLAARTPTRAEDPPASSR